jgi:hypothetical protein
MAVACPHCSGRYVPVRELFPNGAGLLAARAPLRCAKCGGLSYVGLTGRNAGGALSILAIGFALTFPSPVSRALVSGFSGTIAGFIRADIWAIAVLLALLVHVFGAPLKMVEGNAPAPRNIWAFLGTMAFLGLLLLYGYYLIRS